MIEFIKYVRALVMRQFRPNRFQPLSSRYGFDRGTPIDRYWIEKFLSQNSSFIRGRCLEVTDNFYIRKYGGSRVTKSDILDINSKNRKATVYGDLRRLTAVKANSYDCIILTHVLGLIDDLPAAVSEIHRILKPGGTLLLTSSCLGPLLNEKIYWRFTPNSLEFLFGRLFSDLKFTTYGNVLAGQYFLAGLAREELNKEQLDYNDPRYPCIVTGRITK